MIDAVHSRGALLGVAWGVWRVVRCNPLSAGGYDPAPGPRTIVATAEDVSRETG